MRKPGILGEGEHLRVRLAQVESGESREFVESIESFESIESLSVRSF